jgi:hypothetical protein
VKDLILDLERPAVGYYTCLALSLITGGGICDTSVSEIRGPSGPTKHSGFTPLKGVPSRRDLAPS